MTVTSKEQANPSCIIIMNQTLDVEIYIYICLFIYTEPSQIFRSSMYVLGEPLATDFAQQLKDSA